MSETTVREFKAWISGIMEAHGPNYCPDVKVWKKILKKIESLPEEKIVLEQTVVDNSQLNFNRGHNAGQQNHYVQPKNASSFDQIITQPQVPQVPYNVTVSPVPDLNVQEIIEKGLSIPSGAVQKTPNIDTSTGGYRSIFE